MRRLISSGLIALAFSVVSTTGAHAYSTRVEYQFNLTHHAVPKVPTPAQPAAMVVAPQVKPQSSRVNPQAQPSTNQNPPTHLLQGYMR